MRAIQKLRAEIRDQNGEFSRIGVELNTSCPNIVKAPPPAYTPEALKPLLLVLSNAVEMDPSLTVGLKLPPYTYSTQFTDLLDAVASFSFINSLSIRFSPFAFFTCTNTLGSSLLFSDQSLLESASLDGGSPFALPTPLGGLAGETIHNLSLGNVYTFARLLRESESEHLRDIKVVGVGGVGTPAAAHRMRRAGAAAVACATLLGRQGVRAFELLSR